MAGRYYRVGKVMEGKYCQEDTGKQENIGRQGDNYWQKILAGRKVLAGIF